MEKILRIIYNKTVNNEVLNLTDIDKILELLIIEKNLNDYIANINVQQMRSNNLASYSVHTKGITIYIEMIEQMVNDIEANILNVTNFEKMLYKNFSILQVLLHEVEHANQQKIAYHDNSLEALIIRLSYLVNDGYGEKLYEYCPEERLAEIKSFEEIGKLASHIDRDKIILSNIIETETLKRLLRGYHYKNYSVNVPIIDYFTFGNKEKLLQAFELSDNVQKKYTLNERFKYGFPISVSEYGGNMKKLILSLNNNFINRINII